MENVFQSWEFEETPISTRQPFEKLDFVLKWGLNDTYDEQVKRIGYTLTFKANNILDSKVEARQGDETVYSFSPGRSYSLSFSMKY